MRRTTRHPAESGRSRCGSRPRKTDPLSEEERMGEERQIATAEEEAPARPTASASKLSRSEWVLLLVLGAVQFTHIIDFMIVMPLEPHYERELAITPGQFGVVVAVYGFSASIASLFAARFLDRFD